MDVDTYCCTSVLTLLTWFAFSPHFPSLTMASCQIPFHCDHFWRGFSKKLVVQFKGKSYISGPRLFFSGFFFIFSIFFFFKFYPFYHFHFLSRILQILFIRYCLTGLRAANSTSILNLSSFLKSFKGHAAHHAELPANNFENHFPENPCLGSADRDKILFIYT